MKTRWQDLLPSQELEICEDNLNLYFETMYERQKIWVKRFLYKKSQPWTKNEIFKNSKFTNVYRELDRNSQWLIKNIITDETLELTDVVWKILFFRLFNKIETFSDKSNQWKNGIPNYNEFDKDIFYDYLQLLKENGINPYTSSHLISSKGKRNIWFTQTVLPSLHQKIPEIIRTCKKGQSAKELIDLLRSVPGIGGFMSHELYQDLCYVSMYTKRPKFMKFNQNDFTNVGPGSAIGIRLIFPNLKGKDKINGIYKLNEMAETWYKEHNIKFPYIRWNKNKSKYVITKKCTLTLNQHEMWLCEFCKYWKMQIGLGKQRSKFKENKDINEFLI